MVLIQYLVTTCTIDAEVQDVLFHGWRILPNIRQR